ncbi:MAG: bestrophin family ion channel [Polyangiales bacterium]
MHAGRRFTFSEVVHWTRRDIFLFVALSTIPVLLYEVFGFEWIKLPWLPIALVGTAIAFLIGFKNNASYDRMWEARKIWGAIVNSSRSWGLMARDFITNDYATTPLSEPELAEIRKRLIYRHIAWLTALRYQLRQPKEWEAMHMKHNAEYGRNFSVPELLTNIDDELRKHLSESETTYVLSKSNRATAILGLQSQDLRDISTKRYFDEFRHMEMQTMLTDLFTQQGKCERIKNFPFPRQYATINGLLVWIFVLLVPFGMVYEFAKFGGHFVWMSIPFSALVCWVFNLMERVGEVTEHPFQAGPADIPMTALSRTIEIDLRQLLDETETPPPIGAERSILM